MSLPILFGLAITWLTPIWVLCLGVAVGLAVLMLVYGLLLVFSRRAAAALDSMLGEGILFPIMCLALLMSVFAVLGPLVVPTAPLIKSTMRLGAVGFKEHDVPIPPTTRDKTYDLEFHPSELREFEITSDQPVTVTTKITKRAGRDGAVKVQGEPFRWRKMGLGDKSIPIEVRQWTITNLTDQPAHVKIRTLTEVEYPEVWIIPRTALAFLGLVAVYGLLRVFAPKVSAIALVTTKESISHPMFLVVLAFSALLIFFSIFVPYYTFGEDIKMLKDLGLSCIMTASLAVAVFSASVSIADEIEGRTALTLLSKPVRRGQFILGKFLGVLGPVILMFIVLGCVFLFCICYKVVYDAREVASGEPTWQICLDEATRIIPGLVLAFFETTVLTAISVAISTRLPMLANLIVCFSIYVLGNLAPMLANSSVGQIEYVPFVANLIATVLPVLDHFNIQAAIAGGANVPLSYLGLSFVYCVLYCTAAMLLARLMFEDRDLA